ncbi:MAG: membrane protein insertion efficiency factor YidD [Oscillospiraceae bacterium]|nr:membrane protein insertion efficiency factor YidD [Oscillospiraceae bacterium]
MKKLLIFLVRLYQRYVSPAFPPRCCFIPTCSQYAVEALEKHGALKGCWLTLKRLLRCHPFHSSGYDFYDPVP